MSQDQVLDIFRNSEALLEGHFRLTSGRHSNRYVQCAQVLQHPPYTERLSRHLAALLRKGVGLPDVVIGPAMGGILVAYEVGRALGVRAIFTEREKGLMTLRRNFVVRPGETVVVCEDVVTTGGSVREVIDVATAAGGRVAAVAALVDRSNGQVDFGVPFFAALSMEVLSWPPEECPLCKEGTPAIKPGSRT
ncbi:orotate phosphoribosyltransferase [Heliomicrobium modesticaldum Ice1]|uniref:Orotate phosphoribosyltransferase n=1 Tax=Heliobacterium modesticaldum (strain ATCC 51547 / Ice1) TaxID=498761 RepID=PYRE_HELMI|nr:RecName: Full=Orotate phosphoribosyltransferase; Short=OPRT; Short=OPRTase [Heliomicrobium modesticaldum Ice1]ABZ82861.1 orotate phosphoribosyltransferase [Heliomicrobium modesticaldum Ice1]